MSFDCPHCGYPRGLHTPDCPNAVRAVPLPPVDTPMVSRRGVPRWAIAFLLVAIVGGIGWIAYRAMRERYNAPDSFELPDITLQQPTTRRPYLEPKFIDPEIAEEILDDVMSTDWLEP